MLEQGTYRETLMGAAAKSQELPALIGGLADHWGIAWMNAGDHIGVSTLDGLHFEAQDHVTLGHAVAAKVASL